MTPQPGSTNVADVTHLSAMDGQASVTRTNSFHGRTGGKAARRGTLIGQMERTVIEEDSTFHEGTRRGGRIILAGATYLQEGC